MCSWANHCNLLATSITLPNTTIWSSQAVPSGTILTLPDNDPTCNRSGQAIKADMCRIYMLVTTSPTSNISLEAWLPFDWTGRFLSTGNGGLGGCIQYEDMAYGVNQGFATVGANGGHNGTSGAAFYGNPGAVEDFAYRSVHAGTVVGKEVVKAFYEKEHDKSYFLGCSAGGRQGFKAAQDFPGDFDGIVAGAPAFAFDNLTSWRGTFFRNGGAPGDPGYVSPELWSMVHEDVMTKCDFLDGFVDGIIEDPNLCNYRPDDLLCSGNYTQDCLTTAQASAVRSAFSPFYIDETSLVYPRLQPGAPYKPLFAGEPMQYTVDWFRYVVRNDPTWDPATLGRDDVVAASRANPFNVDTWEGDLSRAMNRGTKVMHYHGLQDSKISSDNSMRYYHHVMETMGLESDDLDGFYRYFRISGMDHCSGGPGASFIGNQEASVHSNESDGNVLAAIVKWVEEGVAPESILGTAYVGGTKASGEVAFQRRHCRYPLRNRYDGVGDSSVAESWECV